MSAKVLRNGRVLTALVMLSVFVIMTVLALDFPTKARLMPLMIGIPAILLGLVQLIIEIRDVAGKVASTEPAAADPEKAGRKKSERLMLMWTFLFFVGILCFGFVYASPVLVFCYLYLGSRESLKVSLISGIATWVVIYATFIKWFQIPLFEGLVIYWLFG